jgi:peptide-methionine (S)-S-oxide reductase
VWCRGSFSGYCIRSAIATQIAALSAFYPAEDYHQRYDDNHPENLYIVINDLPKVEHLQKQFPELYVDKK